MRSVESSDEKYAAVVSRRCDRGNIPPGAMLESTAAAARACSKCQ